MHAGNIESDLDLLKCDAFFVMESQSRKCCFYQLYQRRNK